MKLKQFRTYYFWVLILQCILQELAELSGFLQRSDTTLADVHAVIEATIAVLEASEPR